MREIANWKNLRLRYLNGNRRVKAEILKSLEVVYGYSRKGAIRLLRSEVNRLKAGKQRVSKKKPGRKSRYDCPSFRRALRQVWSELDYMCSKNLKSAIPHWLPAFEDEYGLIPELDRSLLLQISPSTIDRILKPYKYLGRGRCGTRPGSLLRNEIPISTSCWDNSEPGFLEGDTVAHCGGSLAGEFFWTLTATDICTTWTEVRPVWHKGAIAVVGAIEDIERSLPFPMKAWDCDNGGEFINRTLVKHFADKTIAFTRSRPYHKNDNAHVEQKNGTHVRHLLGYSRLDNKDCHGQLLYALQLWSLLRNHFYPTRKLRKKFVIRSRTQKIYDYPTTPYLRVLAHPGVSQLSKIQLKEIHQSINPIKIRKQILAICRSVFNKTSVFHKTSNHLQEFSNGEL